MTYKFPRQQVKTNSSWLSLCPYYYLCYVWQL